MYLFSQRQDNTVDSEPDFLQSMEDCDYFGSSADYHVKFYSDDWAALLSSPKYQT